MFDNLLQILKYDPQQPLLFNTAMFLFLYTGVMIVCGFMQGKGFWRILFLSLFSYYFYYKSSGLYFIILAVIATTDFAIGSRMGKTQNAGTKKLLLALSLFIDIGLLVYFKYTNFLFETIAGIFQRPFDPFDIVLPVGISFFTFQSVSYVVDIYRGQIEPLKNWFDYNFYLSFFPQILAGPIVRARDFLPQIREKPLVTNEMFGRAVFLIIAGLFKKAVISDYISVNFVDRIFENPSLYSGIENLMGVYGYALQIYCDFSGYSDMAIGIALLLGFTFRINFDAPYKSATITEFWRRWHISLSSWLKDYLYITLGGNRKGTFRTYLNLMTTMTIGGLWHGASLRYLLWGFMHGGSLALHKMGLRIFPGLTAVSGAEMKPLRRIVGIFLTFNFVCAGWVFFRAGSMETAGEVFRQIFTDLHLELLPELISGYKLVFMMMFAGYLFHFMPSRVDDLVKSMVVRSHYAVKALMLMVMIWIIAQVKSGEIVPFIYFQF